MKTKVNDVVLTKRESQIFDLFRAGKTSRECAAELHLSYFTVETHRKNIHHKLGTHKLMHAVNVVIGQAVKAVMDQTAEISPARI